MFCYWFLYFSLIFFIFLHPLLPTVLSYTPSFLHHLYLCSVLVFLFNSSFLLFIPFLDSCSSFLLYFLFIVLFLFPFSFQYCIHLIPKSRLFFFRFLPSLFHAFFHSSSVFLFFTSFLISFLSFSSIFLFCFMLVVPIFLFFLFRFPLLLFRFHSWYFLL